MYFNVVPKLIEDVVTDSMPKGENEFTFVGWAIIQTTVSLIFLFFKFFQCPLKVIL